jgi:hypothetical protein
MTKKKSYKVKWYKAINWNIIFDVLPLYIIIILLFIIGLLIISYLTK